MIHEHPGSGRPDALGPRGDCRQGAGVMTACAPPVQRLLYALLALALASGWLVAAAVPAGAAVEWGLQSPGPGATLDGAFTINAYVESFSDEQVQSVRARFRRGDQPVGDVRSLTRQGPSESTRLPGVERSTWSAATNPGGMPNGTYVLEVSVTNSRYPDGSPWRGHEVIVDVVPTAKIETVRVASAEQRHVEVRWQRSGAPDFRRYVLERARAHADFRAVYTVETSDTGSHVDTVPEYGEYRYRVTVVRAAAGGGEHEVTSEPRAVLVQPDSSGRPETGEGPSGPLGEQGAGAAPDPPPAGGGASAPRLSTRGPGGSGGSARRGTARPPRPGIAPPDANATFEGRLDYGSLPEAAGGEEDRLADAGGFEDGTLTVFEDEERQTERVLVPVAAGLVFTLGGLHILRFLNAAPP